MSRPVVLSGVLLTSLLVIASFPKLALFYVAWFAFVPLLWVIGDLPTRLRFQLAWISGSIAWMGILFWLLPTFQVAHVAWPAGITGWILLSAYLGLFWALPTLIPWQVHRKAWPLAWACAWTLSEWLRTWAFSGFAWCLLGESQVGWPAFSQSASIIGVFGITFLIQWLNGMIVQAVRAGSWKAIRLNRLGFLTVSVSLLMYGSARLTQLDKIRLPTEERVTVAAIQGNVDQYKKWDPAFIQEIRETYETLVLQADAKKPALIIWPETSVPGYLWQEPPLREWLLGLIKKTHATHVVGAPFWDGNSSYNSAFVIDSKANLIGRYDKQHLVPFGERVPLQSILGKWVTVLNELGGFSAGERSGPIGPHHMGLSICYEVIFPALVRRSVREGAELLVNLTNDGWYLKTAAPYQHLTPNRFRAIENGRWLVRANNTGVTAIISPTGRLVQSAPIFKQAVVEGSVLTRQETTPYQRLGESWLILAFLGLLIYCRPDALRRRSGQ